jgi:integrase
MTPQRRYVPPLEDVIKILNLATQEQKFYLTVVINTMGRIGSINRLKWEDVTEDCLILKTRRAKNSDLKEIKVPLNKSLQEVFSKMERVSEYVFINRFTGKPYTYRSKFLRSLCNMAKIKYFSFHCLRHLGAYRLDKEGVPLTDIQKLLGHERPSTTDEYLRGLDDGLKQAVQKLEV